MSSEPPTSFLSLPPELRLNIYRHLVNVVMSNGQARDLGGIYRSCKTVHEELKNEWILEFRSILDIKHNWYMARGEKLAFTSIRQTRESPPVLCVDAYLEKCWALRGQQYGYVIQNSAHGPTPNPHVAVYGPLVNGVAPLQDWSLTPYGNIVSGPITSQYITPFMSTMRDLFMALQPACQGAWPIMAVEFPDMGSLHHSFELVLVTCRIFLESFGAGFANERVLITFGQKQDLPVQCMKEFNYWLRILLYINFATVTPRTPQRIWVTAVEKEQAYAIGFAMDFRADLERPHGARVKYVRVGTRLTGFRCFENGAELQFLY